MKGLQEAFEGVLKVSLEGWRLREVVLGGQCWQHSQMVEKGAHRGERRKRLCLKRVRSIAA